VEGAFGIWLSKRAVGTMEFPFRHTLTYQTGGWRLDALEDGRIVVRFGERRDTFDVEKGDYLLSAGDDLYLSLKREGRDANGRALPPEDAEREERPSGKDAKKKSGGGRGTSASGSPSRKQTAAQQRAKEA
jgi:hypothetical protein